jgi:hypothetical protein
MLHKLRTLWRWLGGGVSWPGPLSERAWRIQLTPDSLDQLAEQVVDLRTMLYSLIRDVAVFRQILQQRGLWDVAQYRRLRMERMIDDHSTAGATPWHHHSPYPYTLDERAFLEQVLAATPEELATFSRRVADVETAT